MNKAILVDRLNGQNDLSNIESCDVLREDLILDEHSHKITSWQELHQHVEEVRVLEGCVELYDPGTVRLSQDITFRTDMSQLVLLEHLALDERLHGVDLSILLLLDKLDFTKGALSDDLQRLIVLRCISGT